MSVKKPKKPLMDNTIQIPSGAQMLYGLEVEDEIKKKYSERELTESARLEKKAKKYLDKID